MRFSLKKSFNLFSNRDSQIFFQDTKRSAQFTTLFNRSSNFINGEKISILIRYRVSCMFENRVAFFVKSLVFKNHD